MVSAQGLFGALRVTGTITIVKHLYLSRYYVITVIIRSRSYFFLFLFFFFKWLLECNLINDCLILITSAGISVFFVQSLQNDSQSRLALNAGSARECG